VVFVQYLGACEENQKPRNAFFGLQTAAPSSGDNTACPLKGLRGFCTTRQLRLSSRKAALAVPRLQGCFSSTTRLFFLSSKGHAEGA